MIFAFSESEKQLLHHANIRFSDSKDYDEDEALALLDSIRDAQVEYAQDEGQDANQMHDAYMKLGDKIYAAIPE